MSLQEILSEYNICSKALVKPFCTGLINRTWRVNDNEGDFILQKINEKVFPKPENISYNIDLIGII